MKNNNNLLILKKNILDLEYYINEIKCSKKININLKNLILDKIQFINTFVIHNHLQSHPFLTYFNNLVDNFNNFLLINDNQSSSNDNYFFFDDTFSIDLSYCDFDNDDDDKKKDAIEILKIIKKIKKETLDIITDIDNNLDNDNKQIDIIDSNTLKLNNNLNITIDEIKDVKKSKIRHFFDSAKIFFFDTLFFGGFITKFKLLTKF